MKIFTLTLFCLLSINVFAGPSTFNSFEQTKNCPDEQFNMEIEMAKKNGLKMVFDKDVDWSNLDCTTTKEIWDKSSASGLYCRKSNTIILNHKHQETKSTKFHEFQHYKNNFQMPLIENKHPYDLIDFDKVQTQNISKSELLTSIRIALIILWDETRAFQLDIACRSESRFDFNDSFIMIVLKEGYIPRFSGIKINSDQLSTIYWMAKEKVKLLDFENSDQIQATALEIFKQNLDLITTRN